MNASPLVPETQSSLVLQDSKELSTGTDSNSTEQVGLYFIETRPVFQDSRLQALNPCPEFDPWISFDEPRHVYSVDGEEWEGSVTGFVHQFFPEFKEDEVITRMMLSPKWPQSKYYGMTAEQIKAQWEDIRSTAAALGTEMHAYIEYFYNACNTVTRRLIQHEYYTREFDLFARFHNDIAANWIPWRTELRVFDRELRLAGSVDMLYVSPRSTPTRPLLIMYDWKRSKAIKRDNQYGYGSDPVAHLPDANYWHYCLQLNVYKQLIQRNTTWTIESMWLGVFHPNQHSYLSLQVPCLEREVKTMFTKRSTEIDASHNKREL